MQQSVYDPEEDELNRDSAVVPHTAGDIQGDGSSLPAPRSSGLQGVAKQEGFFNPNGEGSGSGSGSTGGKAAAVAGAGLAAAEGANLFNAAAEGGGGSVKQLVRGKFAKRFGIGGGLLGALIGSGVLLTTVLSGPAQLVHLSHILQHPFGNEQSASEGRTGKLFRWSRTGDYGETRLGNVGHFLNKSVQADFEKRGVSFGTDRFGLLESVTIDPAKDSRYSGLSEEDAKAAIAKNNGLDASKVTVKDGKFSFGLSKSDIGGNRAVIKGFIRDQGYGKIMAALKFRALAKYFNVPGWFHPLDRAAAKLDSKLADSAAVDAYNKSRNAKLEARTPETIARNAAIKSKIKSAAGITGALLIASTAVCVAKDIAHQVPDINYANVVVPAVQSGVNLVSTGEDLQYGSLNGSTPSMAEAGAIVHNFKNVAGKTIWDSRALNSMQGMPGGQDLSPDLKQAFSPNSSAASFEKTANDLGAKSLCSGIGLFTQAVLGVALLAVPGASIATKAIGTAAGIAAITAVTSLLPKLLADKPPTGTPQQGPQGGSVAAYGVRAAANTAYRNDGGVAMNPTQTAVLDKQQADANQAQIKSESIATRLLDPYNENSPVGQAMNHLTPSFTQNIGIIARSVPKVGTGIFSSLASIFTPKASAAADASYQWPFPEYAFSQDELNNPLFEDPYENGRIVGDLLNSQGPDSQYIKDAKACFGVDITDGPQGWDAQASGDTNPATDAYISGKCQRVSVKCQQDSTTCTPDELNWLRIRFFIFDTRTADALACYDGLDSSCQKLGIGSNSSSTATSSIGQTQWPFKPDVQTNIIQCFTIHTGGTHPGVDIDAPRGTPVYAITAGTVTISPDPAGYGVNYVLINPDSSTGYGSGYGHMDTATVKTGDIVKVGDQVGTEGSQGHSTGPHLHLNLFQGPSRGDPNNIDPMQALKIPSGSTNGAGCT